MPAEVATIRDFEKIKVLADPRRRRILQLLLAGPATLTGLGTALGEHPAWVRHHLKLLEAAGLIHLDHLQPAGSATEKYYCASAPAFLIHELVLPEIAASTLVFIGSHDLAVELLARSIPGRLLLLPAGSLDGLIALRQGICHLTGCHLFDPLDNDYNLPHVRRLFPDQRMAIVTVAGREQGLIVPPGNPAGIRSLADLARPGLRFINRNHGSGTPPWFDRQLELQGIPADQVPGYELEAHTHTAVAAAVRDGKATAGIGLRAVAVQFGLGFHTLFTERYDLVLPANQLHMQTVRKLLDHMQTAAFRQSVAALEGYDTARTGQQILV